MPGLEPSESDTSQQPLVSVVIPAYNCSGFIAAAVESALNQTLSSFEIIVVNDGSQDTPALEAALQPFLPGVRYFRQENCGPSAARNLGIRKAAGRYVAFLDGDDVWLPQHLAEQVQLLESDSGLGLVYSNHSHIDKDGYPQDTFDHVLQEGPVAFENLLAERCTVSTSSTLVRRDALLETSLFDERMRRCEDFDLWLRLAHNGVKMAYNPGLYILHRLADGLSSNRELMKRARREVYKKVLAMLALTPRQAEIAASKIRELDKEIEIEVAKRHLSAGTYREALAAIERARSLGPDRRLDFAGNALRYCPVFFRWCYGHYVHALQCFKRRRRAHQTAG